MSVASDLESRLIGSFDRLSPKQQAIARLIANNRYYASFASAGEIGEKVGASAATVVRLCQELGYEGLPDLQQAIRDELPTYVTAVERLERRLASLSEDNDSIPQRAFATDMLNVQRTLDGLTKEGFEEAVRALCAAHQILVIGAGVAGAMARFLAYSLRVLGYEAQAASDDDISLAVSLAHLGAGDVAVGIGVWRYVRSTVEALRHARARGALTIALTDSIVSPLARQADCAFEVATDGVAHSLSMTALVTLMNALIAGVSLADPARTTASLRRVDGEFQARQLLLD